MWGISFHATSPKGRQKASEEGFAPTARRGSVHNIKADLYDEAFKKWNMVPIEPNDDYGPAGSLFRFDDGTGEGEYWAYFRDNLFAVNAFSMRFSRGGTMRLQHTEHVCLGYYETADLLVQNSALNPSAGALSAYIANEGAEYVAHYRPGAQTRAVSITVAPDYYRDLLRERFGDVPDVRRAFSLIDGRRDFPELIALFKQIRAYRGCGMAAELFYEGAVAEALALVIERAEALDRASDDAPTRKRLSQADGAALDAVAAFMRTHLGEQITCDTLARRACMGRTKFKEAFKARFGVTPASYLAELRMERAMELLREIDKPIAAVALEVGYRKPGSFTEAFTRATGVLPSAWRAREQNAASTKTPA